jgi:hypothetical protein
MTYGLWLSLIKLRYSVAAQLGQALTLTFCRGGPSLMGQDQPRPFTPSAF